MSGFADGEVDCRRCHESVDHHAGRRRPDGSIEWICPPPAGGPAKGDDDPNTWPEGQKSVLRAIARDGGWLAKGSYPSSSSRLAVERRLGVRFQREHLLHEPP